MTESPKLLQLAAVLSVLLGMASCESAPAEPTPSKPRAAPERAPSLEWTAPPTWNVERTAESGEYRAKYSIPTSGDAKHPAELLVSRIGNADVKERLDALLADFEGPGKEAAKRQELTVGDFTVTVLEVGATYKFPMGPPIGPNKKAPAHVIKDNWRAIGAGVTTKDRGNWFFRLVGPSDTVEGARSAFMAMLNGLK